MKKRVLFIFTLLAAIIFGGNAVGAAEADSKYLTTNEVLELNVELDELINEVNEQLENGKTNVEVSTENVTVGFKVYDIPSEVSANNDFIGLSAIGSKGYQAYVANTKGWNFTHAMSGTFSWDGSKLTGLTASHDVTGVFYSKSANTYTEGVDGRIGSTAKIGKATSKGTFTALKYLPISYHTTLIVDVHAPTKDYRIVRADINS